MEAFRAAVERGIALAELAERELRAAGIWEIVTPAQISVLTFRYAPAHRTADQINALNARIAHATLEDGYAALSTTELRGQTVLRMCVTNPRATEAEISETVRRLGVYARECLPEIETGLSQAVARFRKEIRRSEPWIRRSMLPRCRQTMIAAMTTAAIAIGSATRSDRAAIESAMPMLTAVTIEPSDT